MGDKPLKITHSGIGSGTHHSIAVHGTGVLSTSCVSAQCGGKWVENASRPRFYTVVENCCRRQTFSQTYFWANAPQANIYVSVAALPHSTVLSSTYVLVDIQHTQCTGVRADSSSWRDTSFVITKPVSHRTTDCTYTGVPLTDQRWAENQRPRRA